MAGRSGKCCRSTPRCAGCPVLALRAQRHATAAQRLLAEVLIPERRALPPDVVQQLDLLAAARPPRPVATGTISLGRARSA